MSKSWLRKSINKITVGEKVWTPDEHIGTVQEVDLPFGVVKLDVSKQSVRYGLDELKIAAKTTATSRWLRTSNGDEEKEYIPGGRAEGKEAEDYDKKQIDMGKKVELEHTPDKNVSTEISKDHLEEIPDYYTRLKKMEEDAGIKEK